MTQGDRKIRAYSLYMWIVAGTVVAFNTAAAMSHSARMTYAALALTGLAALAGIGFGLWASLTVTRERRDRRDTGR